MNLRENAAGTPVALLDAPRDSIDRATAARLERLGFRIMTLPDDIDSAIPGKIDVAVIRARAIGLGDTEIAPAIDLTLRLTRKVAAAMSHGGGGRIILVVSSAGRYRSSWFRGQSESGSHVAQAAVEGALISQTRQLAFELAPRQVRINAVAHGWIRGVAPEPDEILSEREREVLLSEISLRRPGEPDEVAAVIAFLAGAGSSYITGTVLDVNGGWWMS